VDVPGNLIVRILTLDKPYSRLLLRTQIVVVVVVVVVIVINIISPRCFDLSTTCKLSRGSYNADILL
jgi:hypothetical protein